MEEAASALALELHPREERLTSLESDFRSREIEFKNALEAKEKENNELKCRYGHNNQSLGLLEIEKEGGGKLVRFLKG